MITAAKLSILITAEADQARREMENAGREIERLGSKARDVGSKLSTWVTAPLLAIGTASAKMVADFDTNMSMMQTVSGATGDEMERLRQLAMDLGNDLSLPGASASDAGEAMLELSKAGLSVNQTYSATRGVLELAAAGGMATADAATVAANALNAFGLAGEDAGRVADLLAAGAVASSAEVSALADSLRQAAAVAAASEIPIEDVVAALAEMSNAGIAGSDAGTSLKAMLMSLQSPTAKASATMERLGITVYDARGEMLPMREIINQFSGALGVLTQEQRNAALATIFGSDAVRAANIVLMGGVDAYDAMSAAVGRQGVAAELAESRMDGLTGAYEQLMNAVQTAMMSAIEPFKGDIEDVVDAITSAVTAFSELDDGARRSIVVMLALAAGAGPAIWAIGALVSGYGAAVPVIAKMTTAIQGLGTAYTGLGALSSALTAQFGAVAVSAGAFAVAIGAVVAAWAMWDKTVGSGRRAVDNTWAKFFDDQAAAGKSAIEVADEYVAAQKRVTDELKRANPIVAAFVGSTKDLAAGYDDISSALVKSSGDYDDYATAAQRIADANGYIIDTEGDLIEIFEDAYGATYPRVIQANYLLNEAQYRTQKGTGDLTAAMDYYNKVLSAAPGIIDPTAAATAVLGDELKQAADNAQLLIDSISSDFSKNFETFAGSVATAEQKIAELTAKRDDLLGYNQALGSVTGTIQSFLATVSTGADFRAGLPALLDKLATVSPQAAETAQKIVAGAGSWKEASTNLQNYVKTLTGANVGALNDEIDATKKALDEERAAFERNTKEVIFNIAQKQILAAVESGVISTEDATIAAAKLAESLGLVDAGYAAIAESTINMTNKMISGEATVDGWTTSIGDLATEINNAALTGQDLYTALNKINGTEVTATVNIQVNGGIPDFSGIGGGGTNAPKPQMYATGVQDFIVPAGYPNDRYPMFVSSGERVTVKPPGHYQSPSYGGAAVANSDGGGWNVVEGDTYNLYVADGQTAALTMALAEERRMARIRSGSL